MTLNYIIFAVLTLCFVGLTLLLIVHTDRQRRRHTARLLRLRPETAQSTTGMRRKKTDKQDQNSIVGRIEGQLAQTSLRVNVTELLVQISLAVLGLYAISVLLLGFSPLLAIPFAIALPTAAVTIFVNIAKARYQAAFTQDLPETLDVFARGLRAGRPVADSLAIVVETSKGPINREFTRCHDEIKMGTSLPDSLERLERRMPTAEVSFFSVATSLQAETGGNLIETMEGLAGQLRERRKLRKKARALTSEARASAVILASLPFAVALVLGILNGAYLEPLINDSRGQMMSAAALGSIAFGVFMMVRMGKLDV